MNQYRDLEISVLNRISQAVLHEKNTSTMLRFILDVLHREMGFLRSTVTLLQDGQLCIETANGLSEAEKQRGKYLLGEGITGQVALTGNTKIIPDISCEPEFINRTGARIRNSHVAFISVPILHNNTIIGTISIDREITTGTNLERDANLLEIVACLIAEAVSSWPALRKERPRPKPIPEHIQHPPEVIGNCHAMRVVYAMIMQVAPSNATVLIRGNSGTGKELVARAIQRAGNRRDKPFIIVNSAALPENLIESELFGHEKGAFTGAVSRRIGRMEAADSGTLFLDEIGDLSISMQVKLLRFLQDRTFQRIGSNDERSSDVRIIAATSRNLEKLIAEGLFREDLYYRLNVFPIILPDLTERSSDIPLLVAHFLEKFNKLHQRNIRRISAGAMNLMSVYSWPGNVRELENCIERTVLTATSDTIHSNDLPDTIRASASRASGIGVACNFTERVEAFERTLITEALKTSHGNVAASARMLNLTVRILHYKIGKLNIIPSSYR